MSLTRRTLLFGSGALVGGAATRWIGGRSPSLTGAGSLAEPAADLVMNDASLLSPTRVAAHRRLGAVQRQTLADELRAELRRAEDEGLPLAVGAARHSMGGQALPPKEGVALTLDGRGFDLDRAALTCRVPAGMTWAALIAGLDPLGFSPKVMQSNNDFGIAATFSVNAHGWPVPHGPMGSTVREISLLLPSGDLVTCSREVEPELFALAMGGYGLIGLIVDLVIEVMPNRRLMPEFSLMPAVDFASAMLKAVNDPSVPMAYGRLDVTRGGFFDEAMLIAYRETEDQENLPPAPGSGWVARRSRDIFRAQLGSDPVKRARWWVETSVGPAIAGATTRNTLLNEPVVTLDDRDPQRTDILHEYFVAPDRFAEFVALCQRVIPGSYQELLNITLRYVKADDTSVLAFAPKVERICAVMLFSQEMTKRAEADMARMTRELIDGTIALGGTYYLPYRPHAELGQFLAAYPRAEDFAKAKRELDPGLVLRNQFWENYLAIL